MRKMALLVATILCVSCSDRGENTEGSASFGLYCEEPISDVCSIRCDGTWAKYIGEESNVFYFENESDCVGEINPIEGVN